MHIRMLQKPPYEVSYDSFTYRVEPRSDETANTSYIAARLLMNNGRLWEPHHEHQLTRQFSQREGASEAWLVGFEAKREFFLPRSLIDRMIGEGAAEQLGEADTAVIKAQFTTV